MGAIVWIASYPKSGNTWIRIFLHNLLRPEEAPHHINRLETLSVGNVGARWFHGLLERPLEDSTHEEVARMRVAAQARVAASVDGLVFVKTHSVFGVDFGYPNVNKEATAGAIYVVRNPLDVAVSLAHYLSIDLDEAITRMNTRGYRNQNEARLAYEPWGSWSENVQSWTRTAHQALFVMRYEDMLAKTEETFAKLRDYLLVEPIPGVLRSAIEHSDFARLREQEAEHGFGRLPPGKRFFREGRVGAWREHLTADQIHRIVECHREQMERFGYAPVAAEHAVSVPASESGIKD